MHQTPGLKNSYTDSSSTELIYLFEPAATVSLTVH
jgi:hypothetical protein